MRLSHFVQFAREDSLREAGIFEYPPAMYATIVKWVDATIAGHYLAKALNAIKGAQENVKPGSKRGQMDVEGSEEWVDGSASELLRNSKSGIIATVDKPMTKWDSYNVMLIGNFANDKDRYVGVLFVVMKSKEDRQFSVAFVPGKTDYTFTEQDWDKYAERKGSNKWFSDHEFPQYLERAVSRAKGAIRSRATVLARSPLRQEVSLVEWNLVRRECLKYTQKPKEYKTKKDKAFSVDFTGWKYLPEVVQGEGVKRHMMQVEVATKSLADLTAAVKRMRGVKGERTKAYRFFQPSGNEYLIWVVSRPRDSGERFDYIVYQGERDEPNKKYYAGDYATVEEVTKNLQSMYLKPLLEKKFEEYESIQDFLNQRSLSGMIVTINFKPHVKRTGQWNMSTREIQVDAHLAGQTNVANLQKAMKLAHKTLQHELQHLGQDYLALLKGLREDAGLPSKSIRQKKHYPSGVPISKKREKRIEHPLRDVEFYTDLKNAVEEFTWQIEEVAIPKRTEFFKEYVGITGEGKSWFFKAWKASNKDKWKKAVKEFTKELATRGISI